MPKGLLQIRLPSDWDRRRFNPDRDMVWALPRLFERALKALGRQDNDGEVTRQLMTVEGIVFNRVKNQSDVLKKFITDLVDYVTVLSSTPADQPAVTRALQRLFDRETRPARLLFFNALVRIILTELPVWVRQARPQSKMDPKPPLEVVEKAADELLKKLSERGV